MCEMKNYKVLNELAEQNGTVIFGGSMDLHIPLCEWKQAFSLRENYYNRSFACLSVTEAKEKYATYIAALSPETVLLHIGEADMQLFGKTPDLFVALYRELIYEIRKNNKKCNIVIISVKNKSDSEKTAAMNKQLKCISESEKCFFCDISGQIGNPKQKREVVTFLHNMGIRRLTTNHCHLCELAKLLYHCS